MANIKPTHKEPISPQSEKFEKDFKKSMVTHNLNVTETQEKLNEIDGMLSEAEQSLKKKIFSLPKMEALVFSDPKLSAIYDSMAENGEEKYGYHYNETIQNMIFNDYVLNSPQYLQKYKNAIPKEKKRRDKSGINQLKKQGQKKMDATGTKLKDNTPKDVDESTTAGSAGGAAGYTGYAGPAAWSKKGDLMGNTKKDDTKIRKPIANITTISESNYLTDSSGFEKYIELLNNDLILEGSNTSEGASGSYENPINKKSEDKKNKSKLINTKKEFKELDEVNTVEPGKEKRAYGEFKPTGKGVKSAVSEPAYNPDSKKPFYEGGKVTSPFTYGNEKVSGQIISKHSQPEKLNEETDAEFIARNGSNTYGSVDNMNSQNQKIIKTDIQKGKMNSNHNIKDGIALQEKSKSQAQQRLMGMAYAYKTGKFDGEPSDEVIRLANSMSEKDLEDFASTKHKGLPEKIDEEVYDKIVKIQYFDKNGQLKHSEGEIDPNNLTHLTDKPIKLTFVDGSEERVSYDEFIQVYSHNDDNKLNINEFLSLHDTVEYLSDREGEKPFMMGDIKWQFVNAKYPDGKVDIGVYRFGQDLVYDYSRWMEEYNINENSEYLEKKGNTPQRNDKLAFSDNNIKEDTQTMIQNNGNSMSNKAQATGDQSSNVQMGTQQTGGLNESDDKLFEEINKELEAFSIHHDKLKIMSEARKTNSQILNARVGDENAKNFKKDFKNSDTKDIINIEKELQFKDQQTDIKDPQKLGMDIEKQSIKNANMKGDEALKNVGNSTNDNGDEVPKRNMTTAEQDEVNLYRNGQHSLNYDNEPDERFVDRMKADQGEFFEIGEKQKEFKKDAPTYNKDEQPVGETEVDKVQFDKNVKKKGDEVAWNERMGLGSNVKLAESMITGRYNDILGKRRLIEFKIGEVQEFANKDGEDFSLEHLFELDFTGLGNKYLSKTIDKKVIVNESIANTLENDKYYTDGTNIFVVQAKPKNLNESENKKEKTGINEEINKMKHLLGYKPDSFVDTKNVKKNRGF